jgi:hypothetical protein
MKNIYILFGILILCLILSKNKIENFLNSQESCNLTTDILNDVNRYSNRVCNENDNLYPNDVTNNHRINCRQLMDKKIYLEKDRTSYCDNSENVPNLKRFKKTNKKFTGYKLIDFNSLSYEDYDNNIISDDKIMSHTINLDELDNK